MKIRSDYVSNSSSSSFVVMLPKEYEFKKFVKDVARGTVAIKDEFFDKEKTQALKERNARNMDYCLNTYELLFLGSLVSGYHRTTIKGKKNVDEFLKNEEYLVKNVEEHRKSIVVAEEPTKLVVDIPRIACNVTVTKDVMVSNIRHWQWNGEDNPKYRDSVVESIVECANAPMNKFGREDCVGLYEITLHTILNTEALLAAKKDLKLDKWCSNLNELKKLIKEGNRIFGIESNQGGDGESCTSIYSLGGWDADALKFANVQVLCCEPG